MGLPLDFMRRLTLAQWYSITDAYENTQDRADYRAGVLASILQNANTDPKKRKRPFEPRDFFPSLGSISVTPQAQSPEEIAATLTRAFGPGTYEE